MIKRRYLVGGALLVGAAVAVKVRSKDNAVELPSSDLADHSDLEAREQTVTTNDGASLLVQVVGPDDAPTVVLAHCWTGSTRTWSPVARRLVDGGYRVVRWDQRGHGSSTTGTDGNTVAALGNDLKAVLDSLELNDVVLSGHSMGGMTVQSYATQHLDDFHARVNSVVLVATAGFGLDQSPLSDKPHLVGLPILDRTLSRPGLGRVFVRNTFGKTAHVDHLEATRADFVATPGSVRADYLSSMTQMDFEQQLKEIDIPVTVICGTRDSTTPLKLNKQLAETIPNAEMMILPSLGHMLVYEAPDTIAKVIVGSGNKEVSPKDSESQEALAE